MTVNQQFRWLRRENDHRFGEICVVTRLWGDKMDYKFVNKPHWKEELCPIDWFENQKEYTEEEISAIKMRERKRRLRAGRI